MILSRLSTLDGFASSRFLLAWMIEFKIAFFSSYLSLSAGNTTPLGAVPSFFFII
jgi:hypothetical protein